jgi:hypothetical protein
MSLLLNLERLFCKGYAKNLIALILKSFVEYGGLTIEQIAIKLICFGLNGVVVFTDIHIGVATQLKFNFAPIFI